MWEIRLFGTPEIRFGETGVTHLRSRKMGSLMGYLACHPEKRHRRDFLVDLLWSDSEPEAAQNAFRVMLTRIREQFAVDNAPLLFGSNREYLWLEPKVCQIDLSHFRHVVQYFDPIAAKKVIEQCRGALLEGHDDAWLVPLRQTCHEHYRLLLQQCLQHEEAQGDNEAALAYAQRLVQADTLDDDGYQHLIRLYLKVGRVSKARTAYQEMEKRFEVELGALPSRKFQDLFPAIVEPRAKTAVRSRKVAPASPQTSLLHLPVYIDSFIGRQNDISEISTLLCSGCRLVTITGFGGLGKTRLAHAVSQRIATGNDFAQIIWVDCVSTNDETSLWRTLRVVVVNGNKSHDTRPDKAALLEALARRPALLVLDNLEQLSDATLHPVLKSLLTLPAVSLLATSRRRLRLSGEQVYPLEAFLLPQPTDDMESQLATSSMHLLLDRIRLVQPHFSAEDLLPVLCDLCRQLEGIPLSIEMAAARSRVFPLQQIIMQIKQNNRILKNTNTDIHKRHESIESVVKWSYDLLSQESKKVINVISVLNGKWTIESVGYISNVENITENISELVDCSLIQKYKKNEIQLFYAFESIKKYIFEELMKNDLNIIQKRHCEWVIQCLKVMRSHYSLETPPPEFGDFHENLCSALSWAVSSRNYDLLLDLAYSSSGYWVTRGYLREGKNWLWRILDILPEDVSDKRVALIIWAISYNCGLLNEDYEKLDNLELLCKNYLKKENDEFTISYLYASLANIAKQKENIDDSIDYLEKSYSILKEINSPGRFSIACNIAWTYICSGIFDEPIKFLKEIRNTEKNIDAHSNVLISQYIGQALLETNQMEEAYIELEYALHQYITSSHNKYGLTSVKSALAQWYIRKNDPLNAIKIYKDIKNDFLSCGISHSYSVLCGISRAYSEVNDIYRAVFLMSNAVYISSASLNLTSYQKKIQNNWLEEIKKCCSEEIFIEAWQDGHSASMEDIIEYAFRD